MRKLWPYVGIALAVAAGLALAPYFWWIAGAIAIMAVPLLLWLAAALAVSRIDAALASEQVRNRTRLDAVVRPFLIRCESIGARMPRWFFWPRRASDAIARVMGYPTR